MGKHIESPIGFIAIGGPGAIAIVLLIFFTIFYYGGVLVGMSFAFAVAAIIIGCIVYENKKFREEDEVAEAEQESPGGAIDGTGGWNALKKFVQISAFIICCVASAAMLLIYIFQALK
jgi:hypothetical protein